MCSVLLPPGVNPIAINNISMSISKEPSYLRRVCLSVSMPTYNNWAPTGLICVKFDTGVVIMKITNKMQLCKLIYYTLSALHVSGDDFRPSSGALDCIYSIW